MTEFNSTAAGFLPVGSILAYAGEVPAGIEASGWLPCDGRSLSSNDYKELFQSIQKAFGAPDNDHFNLPALEGMFLRGMAHGVETDPSAKSRKELRPGGATGDAVGSLQPYGTAQPKTKFTADIPNYNVERKRYDKGSAGNPAAWNDDTTTPEAGGGDKESRPKNKYIIYLIKIRERMANGHPVQVPVGALISFASAKAPDPARWVLCDGRALSPKGEWSALHSAIGFAHGETKDGEMVLPDYRGYFLRGVSGGSKIDPDAAERGVPYPDGAPGKQGNGGNKVASVQQFATGAPTSSPFTTTFTSLPKSRPGDGIDGAVRYLVHGYGSRKVSLSQGGGDSETRPINLSIAWYMRAR